MGYFDQMKAILGEGLADKKKPKPQFPNVLMAPPGPAMPSGTEQTPQPRPLEQTPLEKQQDFVNQDLMNPPPEPPSPYDAAKKDYESAVAAPAEKQPLWKQVLFVALQGVKQAATGDFSQPIQFLGNAKRDYKIQQAGARYGPLRKQKEADIADQYATARTTNIYADNQYQQDRLKDLREYRESTRREGALKKVVGLKRLDPANAAHAAALRAAGLRPEDVKGWDDSNPVEKTVAGVSYRLNKSTGAYEPTNLPVDESKTLVDYKVKTPDGEMRTFKVAQKDAANFATQMNALGMRLAQSESQFQRRHALDQAKFSQAKQVFQQTIELRRQAEARNDQEAVRKYQKMLVDLGLDAEKAKADGELDDEQYNVLSGMIGNIQ
jgi:hypothetical protein